MVIFRLSILRFELWAHPVRIGPGRDPYAIVNGAVQYQCCGAISRIRDQPRYYATCPINRRGFRLVLHSPRQAIGFHLGPDLRHIVPEYHDIVLFAVDIPHMVAQ